MDLRRNVDMCYSWMSAFFALSIAFPRNISVWIFGFWTLFTVIRFFADSIGGNLKFSSLGKMDFPCLLLLGLSIIGLCGVFYADSPDFVVRKTFGPRCALLLLPLLALLNRRKLDFNMMLKYFIIGNALSIVFSLCFIAYRIWGMDDIELHRDFFKYFMEICNGFFHRTYLGLNILLSYVALYYLVKGRVMSWCMRIACLSYVFVSAAFIFLNNSRVITLCLLLLAMLFLLDNAKRWKRVLAVLVVFVSVSLLSLFFLPSRTSQMFLSDGLLESLRNDPRAEIWPSVWNLIAERPVWGYGLDNIDAPLATQYLERGFLDGVAFGYAPHNEYLSEWSQLGLPGLLLFVSLFVSLLLFTDRGERRFWIPFVLLFSIVSLSESLLDRYHGCLTLSFFVALIRMKRVDETDFSVEKGFFIVLSCFAVLSFSLFSISLLKVRCFSPETIINRSGNRDEKGVFVLCDSDLTTFMYEGRCISCKPLAFCDLMEGEHRTFKLDCLASEDFDGSVVKVIAEKDLGDGTHIPTECLYDLARKSEWQTLSLDVDGKQTIILYIFGDDKFSFEELKGKLFFKDPCFFTN